MTTELARLATNLDTDINRSAVGTVPLMPKHVQLSHAKQLRNTPYNYAMQKLRELWGDKNQCGHEKASQTFDHIDPRLFLCLCGKIHQDHSIENGRIICFNCNSGRPKLLTWVQNDRKNDRARVEGQTASEETRPASAEMARSLEIFPAYRQITFDVLHGKSNSLILKTPGAIPCDAAGGLIANEVGKGVAQTYSNYFKQDALPNGILEKTETLTDVRRVISGKIKLVKRTILNYECKECYEAWQKRTQTDPLAQREPLDHPAYPSGRGLN